MDIDAKQLLIYNHVLQLTLIDYEVDRAFELAHEVAARAFDEDFTQEGLAAAMKRRAAAASKNPSPDDAAPTAPKT